MELASVSLDFFLLQPDAVHRPNEVEHVDADRRDAGLGVSEGGRSVALENAEGGDCVSSFRRDRRRGGREWISCELFW